LKIRLTQPSSYAGLEAGAELGKNSITNEHYVLSATHKGGKVLWWKLKIICLNQFCEMRTPFTMLIRNKL
jgi:hypothetical protein